VPWKPKILRRPFFEEVSIRRGCAQHFGDQHNRQRVCDLVDEIKASPRYRRRDHRLGELADARLERRDRFRREGFLHERPHARVVGRIGADHVFLREVVAERAKLLPLVVGQAREKQALPVFVGEVLLVLKRRGDVVEAAHDPSLPLVAPKRRRLVPQAAVDRIRIHHHRRRDEELVEFGAGTDPAG